MQITCKSEIIYEAESALRAPVNSGASKIPLSPRQVCLRVPILRTLSSSKLRIFFETFRVRPRKDQMCRRYIRVWTIDNMKRHLRFTRTLPYGALKKPLRSRGRYPSDDNNGQWANIREIKTFKNLDTV